MKTNVYKLMLALIEGNRQTKEELLTKAEVFHKNGRLTDPQLQLVIEAINKKFQGE